MRLFSNVSARRVGAVATALLMAVAGFVVDGGAPAAADVNGGIAFADATLKHTYSDGRPLKRDNVWVHDYLEFSVNYDATKANPQPGDSFTVTLPKALKLRDVDVKKPLLNGEGTAAGECALANPAEGPRITCVFNDAIKDKVDVKGTLKANLYIADTTTENSVGIDFNGKVTPVPLPYGKPIIKRPASRWQARKEPAKYSEGVSSTSTAINWIINVPGDWANANYAAGKPVEIADNLTPGVLFVSPKKSASSLLEYCPDPSDPRGYATRTVADSAGKSVDGFAYDLKVERDHNVTITGTGKWRAGCEYHFRLQTTFAGGKTIDKATTYENSATFVGLDKTVSGSRKFMESFSGTIQYRDGFGGFKVSKSVAGDDADLVADKTYTFDYTCTDGQSGAVEASAKGGAVIVDKQFREGTTCTVAESGQQREGYVWSGEASKDVTIVAGQATEVAFVNTYAKASDPQTTPTPSPTPAPSPTPSVAAPSPSAIPTPSAATPPASDPADPAPSGKPVRPTLPKTGR